MRWRKWKYPIPGTWPIVCLVFFPVLRVIRFMSREHGPQMLALEQNAAPEPARILTPDALAPIFGPSLDPDRSRVVLA